jgi:peptidoglycan/xylan/chitin deacetylase (PgdA/CDA1 family)
MMRTILAAIIGAALLAAPASAQPAFQWPDGRQAAIMLTYDDAAPSQLQFALPTLDAANVKGTFFLSGARMSPDGVSQWRAAAANGHELANHTLYHPCARGRYDMPPQYNTENYSVATMLAEIQTMNTMLTAIDGKLQHAYGPPCGDIEAGGENFIAALEASGLSTFIRDERATPVAAHGPPMQGIGFVEASGADMIAWVEQVRAQGGGGIIVFHGIGGDYLSVSAEAHAELVAYLAAHNDEIWTTTFSEAMAYVKAHGNP